MTTSSDILRMTDIDLRGKRTLIREDLNVPVAYGKVASDKRLLAAVPTIEHALGDGAAVLLMSHLGRPEEGRFDEEFSLAPVAARLSQLLNRPVELRRDYLDGVECEPDSVILLENVRFHTGEIADDAKLAKRYAALCDVFVMDAFGTAHRAQASTHGVARLAPVACAGPLLMGELEALERALSDPAAPLLAIVGGSKVSTKIDVLEALTDKVDQLIVGGGIANTFLAAAGREVGKSLYEPDKVNFARRIASQIDIPLPVDVVVAPTFAEDAPFRTCPVSDVRNDEMILDVGPETAARYADLCARAGTILWNGPIGVFEFESFANGTRAIAEAVAASDAFSLSGGGDTAAAIEKFGVADDISYISTGGGAFLTFVEGKKLPAVRALAEHARAAALS